jgi:HD-like signal output (HDOD) protein
MTTETLTHADAPAPVPSLALQQLLEGLREDPFGTDVNLSALAAQLQAFAGLPERVIAAANSAVVGTIKPISELRHAMVYMGFRRLLRVLDREVLRLEAAERTRRAA